jgi:hypothetical protein
LKLKIQKHEDFSIYDRVFCESKDALQWAYKNKLAADAKIYASSPAMLHSNMGNIINIELGWSVEKMKKFQTTIQTCSENIFDSLMNNTNVSREEAMVVVRSFEKFQRTIYKVACLKEKHICSKSLFIKICGNGGPLGNNMNPPWDKVLGKSVDIVSFNIKNNIKDKNSTPLRLRLKLGGFSSLLYRILLIATKYMPGVIFHKKTLIPRENELVIETAVSLVRNRVFPKAIKLGKNSYTFSYDNFSCIQSAIKGIVSDRLLWVDIRLKDTCRDIFFDNLLDEMTGFINIKHAWKDVLDNEKNSNKIILMSYPSNLSGYALSSACQEYKPHIPIISTQHGVTMEISKINDEVSTSYEINNSDCFFSYNKAASNVAEKSYFAKGRAFDVGMSSRHIRVKVKALKGKTPPIVYISQVLYRGSFGGFVSWCTDYKRFSQEKEIVNNVLSKIPHIVRFKTYPFDNSRYPDPDPIIDEVSKVTNIELFDSNIDMRYLFSESRVLIVSSASSTVGWAIMSETPLIFINRHTHAPLTDDAYKYFSKGVFVFDDSHDFFHQNLLDFLSKPISEIEELWSKKKSNRKKMIRKYFSSNDSGAGRLAANKIMSLYFNN